MSEVRKFALGKYSLMLLLALWVTLVLLNQYTVGNPSGTIQNEQQADRPSKDGEEIIQANDLVISQSAQVQFQFHTIESPEEPEIELTNEGKAVLHQFLISQSKNFKILLQRIISKNAP
jgi:hypothetical protein